MQQQLLSQVQVGLSEERQQLDEWKRLEQTNAALRKQLHSSILATQRTLTTAQEATTSTKSTAAATSSSESTPPLTRHTHAALLSRTAAFLASSNALLRSQLRQTWQDASRARVALSQCAVEPVPLDDGGGVTSAPSTTEQKEELEWILTALPNVGGVTAPPLPHIPPAAAPPPEPLTSHSSQYCELEYPLERITSEWRDLFPVTMLAGEKNTDMEDRKGWEELLEQVWDAVQSNRTLYAESAPRSTNVIASAASSSSSFNTSTASASVQASKGIEPVESIILHAQENFGFVLAPTLHARMMGCSTHNVHTPQQQQQQPQSYSYPSYEFDEPDGPQNIVMESGDPTSSAGGAVTEARNIKCATLNKLIERVTHEKFVDLNIRYVFLLTYHSFTTPRELLAKLSKRFHVPLPPNLTASELHHFKIHKLGIIQIRVCSVLKNWLEEHWSDFADSRELRMDLHELVDSMLKYSSTGLATKSAGDIAVLCRKKEMSMLAATQTNGNDMINGGGSASDAAVSSPTATSTIPKLLISSKLTLANFSFLDCNEIELARQLALLDFAKFRSIQPRECLNQNWSKPPAIKAVLAPNILAMIHQFNRVSIWVELTILRCTELKARIKVYEKFIKIAEECRSLNNFNSLFAIYCGLTANPIHRLKKTHEGIREKRLKRFQEFVELFRGDKNSRNFRRTLQQSLTPCIPHLGIFLSDLTFTEDGNPDYLLGNMINFQKRCKLAERIRWIKQYQQEGYNFHSSSVIQAYLEKQWEETIDPETLWKMSKEIEPTVRD